MRNLHHKKSIGAFLTSSLLIFVFCLPANAHEFKTYKNVLWSSPKNIPLTVDIYVPETGKKSYPVLVIYHGGGWLINNNSIMHSMPEHISKN